MKKIINYLQFFSLLIILSYVLSVHSYATDNTLEGSFSGERTITYYADSSDFDSFIEGGRTWFDIQLRKYSPNWLSSKIKTSNRVVYITLSFQFESYEDYHNKISLLTGTKADILYDHTDEFILIEKHKPFDLFNHFINSYNKDETISQKPLNELLALKDNIITINKDEYRFGDCAISIPDTSKINTGVTSLAIITNESTDTIERTVTLMHDSNSGCNYNPEWWTSASDRFTDAGNSQGIESLENGSFKLSVTFSTNDLNSLSAQTSNILSIPVKFTISDSHYNDTSRIYTRTELLATALLIETGGVFEYTWNTDGSIQFFDASTREHINDNSIMFSNQTTIEHSIINFFEFSNVEIVTNINNFTGKINKSIIFSLPIKIAVEHDSYINECITNNLINGTIYTVYDSETNRVYELKYSSYFIDDVNKFCSKYLGKSHVFDIQDSWIPYGNSSITEKYFVAQMILSDHIPTITNIKYVLGKNADYHINKNAAESSFTNGTLELSDLTTNKLTINYNRINPIKTILLSIILGLTVFIIVIISISIKNRFSKKDTASSNATIQTERIDGSNAHEISNKCPDCGSELRKNSLFCPKCGKKL